MLGVATMSRTALALVLVAASAPAASAGTYLGLGIGPSPATSGDLEMKEDGRSGRFHVGYQFARVAVEGLISRADMYRLDHPYTWTSLALAGKLNFPLASNFEAFGRAGIQYSTVDRTDYDSTFSGAGFLVGGGFEYRVDLGTVAGSIFVDYTIEHANTTSPQRENMTYGLTSRVWTLGATVSL